MTDGKPIHQLEGQAREAAEKHLRWIEESVGGALAHVQTKEQLFSVMRQAFGIEGKVWRDVAARQVLSNTEQRSLEFAACLVGACIRTLENNPLFGCPALGDQLRHNLRQHLRNATAVTFEVVDEDES